MDGDQKPQAPANRWQNNPVDNHPSLVEPSLPSPQAVTPPAPPQTDAGASQPLALANSTNVVAAVAPSTDVAPSGLPATETTPEGGFYHAGTELTSSVPADMTDDATEKLPSPAVTQLSWVSSGESLRAPAAGWKVRMTIASVIFGALIFLITRDFVSSSAVAIAGILFGFLGDRKPQALAYQMDQRGITIGQKRYSYGEFRAFSVANDSALPSVELAPLKRFAPVMSVQLDPEQHDQIITMFSSQLPMEAHKRDAIDTLTGFLTK